MKIKTNIIIILSVLFAFLFFISTVSAEVVVNSADWKDVYSGLLYSRLIKQPGYFVMTDDPAQINSLLLPLLQTKSVIYIESKTPKSISARSVMLAGNKEIVDITVKNNINLDLLENIPDITHFILLDDSLPFYSIPIIPYAIKENFYVLFVNTENVDEMFDLLSKRTVDQLLIYGNLEPAVKEKLNTVAYPKKFINTGDKYDDNIEILRLFYESQTAEDSAQLYLYDGEFLDAELFTLQNPILLIMGGKIPDRVEKFVLNSPIKSVVAPHPSMGAYSQYFRKKFGFFTVTKMGYSFAKGTVNFGLNDINVFVLPIFVNKVSIEKMQYNTYSQAVQVHYRNDGDINTYFTAARHSVVNKKINKELVNFLDKDVYYLQQKEKKIIIYPNVSLNEFASEKENLITVTDLLFGDDPESVDNYKQINTTIDFIDYRDDSVIELVSIKYNKRSQSFIATVKNLGKDVVFVDVTAHNVLMNDAVESVSGELTQILPTDAEKILIPAVLTENDLLNNKKINIEVRYGQSDDELIKTFIQEADFIIAVDYSWLIIVIIILLILTAGYFFFRKRRKF